MTQEEKDLLLKDLMARVRYRVRAKQYYSASEDDFIIEGIIGEQIYAAYNSKISMTYPVEKIKPYLRPMSSMTDEEREEENKLWDIITKTRNDLHYLYTDFLLSHNLDYRGLIPMGLALEASEEMYSIK